jgi:hypothetical protein
MGANDRDRLRWSRGGITRASRVLDRKRISRVRRISRFAPRQRSRSEIIKLAPPLLHHPTAFAAAVSAAAVVG